MKIVSEISISDFKAWSGARDTLDRIINEDKCDTLEAILEDMYPDGMTDTELNDLLWFDDEAIFEWLGISDKEEEEEEEFEDNGLPDEANENYEEIAEKTALYDTFEEFCKHDEFGLLDCKNCVMGCLTCNTNCEEVFNRFKELEG